MPIRWAKNGSVFDCVLGCIFKRSEAGILAGNSSRSIVNDGVQTAREGLRSLVLHGDHHGVGSPEPFLSKREHLAVSQVHGDMRQTRVKVRHVCLQHS